MSNTIRIKRRASGADGAPASLQNAELAFNEVDNTLYYGYGAGGAGGTATTVDAIGGSGAFATLSTAQTFSATKTFSSAPEITVAPTIGNHATNKTYVDDQLALKANIASPTFTGTVSGITASMVGLGNVTNTSDADKPVSTAQQTALNLKANIASPTFTGTVSGITKSMVGLDNVDNTSDAAKPVSSAQQTALNLKANIASPTFTGTVTAPVITGLNDPTNPSDAATKSYVDAARAGLDVKDSVRAATTTNITLSGTQVVDGVSLVVGDRVLVKNQTDDSNNGIYVVESEFWTRATDANTTAKVNSGMFTFVEEGSVNDNAGFVLATNEEITLGDTSLEFVQFSGAGSIIVGTGLSKSGNTLSIDSTVATLSGTQTFTGTKIFGGATEFGQTIVGSISGNAATVTTNANLTGDITSTGNATAIAAGVIVNADINASAAIADTKLATIATALKVSNSATTATSANTANAIVSRDSSSNFTAGTVTAALSGNATTATTLQNARTLTIGSTGKSFNGSANVTWTLAEIGAAAIAQTMHIGTTAVNINRASAALTLTGITLDGGTF